MLARNIGCCGIDVPTKYFKLLPIMLGTVFVGVLGVGVAGGHISSPF